MGHHHEEEKLPNHLAMTQEEYKHHKSDVWKTTILLSIVTVVEVIFAIWYEKVGIAEYGWSNGPLRAVLVIMSLLKAGYIMAVFMHVKHEKKMFIVSILVPFSLLIWMIISFLYEGGSWGDNNKERFGDNPDVSIREQHKGVGHEAHH